MQIYEIQEAEEVAPLIALGVDHLGTVIPSRDKTTWPPLQATVQAVQAGKRKSVIIPLFSELPLITDAIAYFQPDIVHFCEVLSPLPHEFAVTTERAKVLLAQQWAIRAHFPFLHIMRSLPVPQPGRGGRDVTAHCRELVHIFSPSSDYFLIDTLTTGAQPVEGFVGITGEIADWSIARDIVAVSPRPVILAGGLGPDNVADAIKYVRPAGVDSCTQTNARDGYGRPIRFRKDLDLVRLFVREVRRVEHLLAADDSLEIGT